MKQRSLVPAAIFRVLTAVILYVHPVTQANAIPPIPTAPPRVERFDRPLQGPIDSHPPQIAVGARGAK